MQCPSPLIATRSQEREGDNGEAGQSTRDENGSLVERGTGQVWVGGDLNKRHLVPSFIFDEAGTGSQIKIAQLA